MCVSGEQLLNSKNTIKGPNLTAENENFPKNRNSPVSNICAHKKPFIWLFNFYDHFKKVCHYLN